MTRECVAQGGQEQRRERNSMSVREAVEKKGVCNARKGEKMKRLLPVSAKRQTSRVSESVVGQN